MTTIETTFTFPPADDREPDAVLAALVPGADFDSDEEIEVPTDEGLADVMARLFGGSVTDYFRNDYDPEARVLDPDVEARIAAEMVLIERDVEVEAATNLLRRHGLSVSGTYDRAAAPRPSLTTRLLRRSALRDLPKPEPIIAGGVLFRRTLSLLAGSHATGKSFVALDWSASIATGTPWQGRRVEPGRVLYVIGEGAHGIDDRLTAWETEHGIEIPDDRLDVVNFPVQLGLADDVAELVEVVTAQPYDLVVVDTLARSAVGLEENSATDMGRLVAAVGQVITALDGGSVLLVHHTGKDRSTVRGSSALEGAADTVHLTDGKVDSRVTLKHLKNKYGPENEPMAFRLKVNGASGVLVSTEALVEMSAPREVEDAYTALRKAFAHAGSFTKSEAVTVLVEDLDLSRATVYRRLDDLATRRFIAFDTKAKRYEFLSPAEAGVGTPFG